MRNEKSSGLNKKNRILKKLLADQARVIKTDFNCPAGLGMASVWRESGEPCMPSAGFMNDCQQAGICLLILSFWPLLACGLKGGDDRK